MQTHTISHQYSNEGSLFEDFQDSSFIEKLILFLFLGVIALIFSISLWSSVLLVTGNTQGGGPLGMIAGIIINFLS